MAIKRRALHNDPRPRISGKSERNVDVPAEGVQDTTINWDGVNYENGS